MFGALGFSLIVSMVHGAVYVPDLPSHLLSRPGDINLAALIPVYEYSLQNPCGDRIRHSGAVQHVAAFIHAIDRVNSDPHLLANLTLGYAIADDCGSDKTALALTLRHFVPPDATEKECDDRANKTAQVNEGTLGYFPVSGIVGPFHSSGCITVANFLSLVHLPIISPIATNDDLSNKAKYRYFMRMVPPDQYQAKAMVDLLAYFNWTYVSLLNSEGVYGTNGIRQVAKYARLKGICVAYSAEILFQTRASEYDFIMRNLLRHSKSRVIVGFLNHAEGLGILSAAKRVGAAGQFVWIFSDTFNQLYQMAGVEKEALGAFMVAMDVGSLQNVPRSFKQASTYQDENNIFYRDYWRTFFNCNLSNSSCSVYGSKDFETDSLIPLIIDSVMTFAHGLNNSINENCHHAINSRLSDYIKCALEINGSTVLQSLYDTQFEGSVGEIEFDKSGDVLGKYVIKHLTKETDHSYKIVNVGRWSRIDEKIVLGHSKLTWSMNSAQTPESICSKPCETGQYFTYQDVKCCWICRDCRENEILSAKRNSCSPCPPFTWPDNERKRCGHVDPVHIPFSLVSLLLQIAAATVTSVCLILSILFIKFRNKRLIKASSKELSALILFGIILTSTCIYFMVAKPSKTICVVNYVGFGLSFTLAYGPLLAKVNRIYRIFEGAKSGVTRTKYTSPRAQILISLAMILNQVGRLKYIAIVIYHNNGDTYPGRTLLFINIEV